MIAIKEGTYLELDPRKNPTSSNHSHPKTKQQIWQWHIILPRYCNQKKLCLHPSRLLTAWANTPQNKTSCKSVGYLLDRCYSHQFRSPVPNALGDLERWTNVSAHCSPHWYWGPCIFVVHFFGVHAVLLPFNIQYIDTAKWDMSKDSLRNDPLCEWNQSIGVAKLRDVLRACWIWTTTSFQTTHSANIGIYIFVGLFIFHRKSILREHDGSGINKIGNWKATSHDSQLFPFSEPVGLPISTEFDGLPTTKLHWIIGKFLQWLPMRRTL